MKPVKLTVPLLIEDTHRNPGDVVLLSDHRAAELVKLGHAEPSDSAEVVNPGANALADQIHPAPPAGDPAAPAPAATPRRTARTN